MSQKNKARHLSNYQIAAEKTMTATDSSTTNVTLQKRKEDAKQTFYLNRI